MSVEFVDTNVIVYAHDLSAGRKREEAVRLIVRLIAEGAGCLSVQVLMELAVTLTRKLPKPLSHAAARDIVADFATWRMFTPRSADVLLAMSLAERHQISFWDAMIVRAAIMSGAKILWSEDLSNGQVYDGVEVRNPFA